MHIDSRELENNSLIQGDICIIGAGAAGISMALEWVNSPFTVILLEAGGFEFDQAIQDSYNGQSTGQRYFPLMSSRLHMFGGTTSLWGGFCATFDPIDFEERAWVPDSGWPFDKTELDPYYERCQSILDLPSSEFELEHYKNNDPNLYSIPFNNDKVWNKIWQFSPPTRFGAKYKDAIVNSKNIHLYTYAKATELIAREQMNGIEQVVVKNINGHSHKVKAGRYILACGAIQNARMLLASNKQALKGLGNQHDVVGRYFMEHLEMLSSAELWMNKELPLDLYLHKTESKFRAEWAISDQLQEKERILNGTVNLRPLAKARLSSSRENVELDSEGNYKSKSFFERVKNKLQLIREESKENIELAYLLGTRIEQSPNPNSRITLGDELDTFGMPMANLHWELTRLDKFSIRKIYEILGLEIGRLDIGRVKLLEWLTELDDDKWPESTSGGWHHMGTTRMNTNPKKGVVDANCQVHGLDNLYLAGSSCFPTAGSVNPTLTLIALTLRLSDYLKGQLKKP